MNLDFGNPTVQVAAIAAAATVITAFLALLTALVNALSVIVTQRSQSRIKRLEHVRELRAKASEELLSKIAATQNKLDLQVTRTAFIQYNFLKLLQSTSNVTPETLAASVSAFKAQQILCVPGSDVLLADLIHSNMRDLDTWFEPQSVGILFWFPKPLKFRNQLVELIEEYRGVYFILLIILGQLTEHEKSLDRPSALTGQLRQDIQKAAVAAQISKYRERQFKKVIEVQKVLVRHLR